MIASFVFELDTYCVNGYAAQANGSVTASRTPPNRRPTSSSPSKREQVERDRRRVHGRQLVPAAAPAERPVRRHVGLVRDRPVRVAALVGRLAAPVRLHALTDLTVGVLRPAGLQRPLDRHVTVGRLAVDDPVRADHARVADVDHVRVAHVEPEPKAGQEDRGRREQPERPDRPRRAGPAAPDAPDHASRAGTEAAGRRAARS